MIVRFVEGVWTADCFLKRLETEKKEERLADCVDWYG